MKSIGFSAGRKPGKGTRIVIGIFAAIIIILVLLFALIAKSISGGNGGKSQQESMVTAGMLTVGIINGEDAYASGKDGTFTGIEPEIARRLGEGLGLDVTYIEASGREELLGLLEQGSIDMAMGRLPEWKGEEGLYRNSSSYGRGGVYLVTDRYWYIDSLAAVEDGSVISISGSVSDDLVTEINGIERMELQRGKLPSDMSADIIGELSTAAICTEREALAMVKQEPELLQATELQGGPRERYTAYVLSSRPGLAANLNGVISKYLDERAQGLLETDEEQETLGTEQKAE